MIFIEYVCLFDECACLYTEFVFSAGTVYIPTTEPNSGFCLKLKPNRYFFSKPIYLVLFLKEIFNLTMLKYWFLNNVCNGMKWFQVALLCR